MQADLEAARNNIAPLSEDEIEPLGLVLARGWFFLIPFAVLITALFQFNRTPTEAALWASIVLLVVGLKGYKTNKLNLNTVFVSLKVAGQVSVNIIIIGAMAGLIIGLIEVTGLSFGLTFMLVQVGEHSLLLLLILTGLVSLILGMGMPTTAIYFLVAVLAAPPLIRLGVNPLAAHLFVLYYGLLSLITPPVAIAAFTAAFLAGAPPMATAVYAVRYGWPAFVLPFVFVMSPALILQGEIVDIIRAVTAACLGIWAISLSIGGWFARQLNMTERAVLLVSGIALFIPVKATGLGWLDFAGAVVLVLFIARALLAKHHKTQQKIMSKVGK
jgi:TRAP transporter 4TM/12TM fusion protein